MEKLNKQIREVFNDITRLSNALYAMESTDFRRFPDNYEVLSTDAALRAERIACALRHLIYHTEASSKASYLKQAGDELGIQIQYQNEVMEFTLPALLPKRRQHGNPDFILDPLRCILQKYTENNPCPKFKECVVCFSHTYGNNVPERAARDYDNLELKQILDVIISHIMVELPGKQKCAYYCITSDQDSTFDFLSSLFISFLFIRLVRYADKYTENRSLPVPVHVLGEELNNVGVLPDLSRKISVIRSRNISMSCVFQNLAGLQNRYPNNQWQEILGNCDVQLFLGCTDELTAKFISDRTGIASVEVSSESKQLNSWRISDYTPEFRESSGVGKRNVLTMDEVLRLPIDEALVILRGQKVLKVDKYDYSKHPEAEKLTPCKASDYFPQRLPAFEVHAGTAPATAAPPKNEKTTITASDKGSIIL